MALKEYDGFVVDYCTIKSMPSAYLPDARGLGFEMWSAMQLFKDNVAQYIPDTDERETYGSLLSRSVKAAIKLKSLNIPREKVICICSENHKNTCVPYIAAIFLGYKVACLAPELSVKDTAYLLSIVEPAVVFASEDGVRVVEEAAKLENLEMKIVSFGKGGHMSFEEFLQEDPKENQFKPNIAKSINDVALIVFTSGSAGKPKGVCLSHYTIMAKTFDILPVTGTNCRSGFIAYRFEEAEDPGVFLCYSTFYWISASLMLTCGIFSGSALVICSKFVAEDIFNLVDGYKITYGFLAPYHLTEICQCETPDDVDISSLKNVVYGGASLPLSVTNTFRSKFPEAFVTQGFGCTEMGGSALHFDYRRPEDVKLAMIKPQSCGRPVPGICYMVVDPAGEALGAHHKGELLMSSAAICTGYYNSRDTPFNADGWLPTGDLVYYDEDYCFYMVDRLKDMLKFRCWQIPPARIEEVVIEHPAVLSAAVIGLPHAEYGDLIIAVVKLDEKYSHVTREEIQKFVDERVDDHKRLRGGVKFIKEFPLTPSGKVRKFELKQMIVSGELK